MANICVLGAGGWGTALAVMANRQGHNVTLWSPFAEEVETIRRHGQHIKLLPNIAVLPSIELTTDVTCAVKADLVIFAVPSFAIAQTAKQLCPHITKETVIANAGKGLEENTFCRFTEVIKREIPLSVPVALSGPSHAEEVGRSIPTVLVSASQDIKAAQKVQSILTNPSFRIYTSNDVIGVELGGALKNVIALAAGICDGLDMGDNTKAALMTRGLAEIARLGASMGADLETFAGLSGMGDLIVTCGSMHSRNRRAGILIGQGVKPKDAVQKVGTVEGFFAAKTAFVLSQRQGVEMPITEACYRICYKGLSPKRAVDVLMQRPCGNEQNGLWMTN